MKLCKRLETVRGFTESGILRGKSQQDLEKQLQLFGGATFPSNLLTTEREKGSLSVHNRCGWSVSAGVGLIFLLLLF